jgi:hypothetical protein
MKTRRPVLYFFLLIILWLQAASLIAQDRIALNMDNLGQLWQEYIASPGGETAGKVYEALPDGVGITEVELQTEVRELIFKNINVLESQLYRGDRNSLRMAFRLFIIADSEMETALVKIIGYLQRFNTKLFLEELKTHEHLVPNLERLVCYFMLSNPEDKAKQNLEKNICIKALGYVEDKELKSIKKKCLKILKKLKTE